MIHVHPACRSAKYHPDYAALSANRERLIFLETLTTQEAECHYRAGLSSCKKPRRVEFSEAVLPKNSAGTVLKRVLRQWYWTTSRRSVA